ncbi:hypothetical protein BKA83DRAFT_4481123 [Pisolithus microcarpus]|nr:hypothetical protein BKA83DRAFT_4481123 [Pisolithus microcarpus]
MMSGLASREPTITIQVNTTTKTRCPRARKLLFSTILPRNFTWDLNLSLVFPGFADEGPPGSSTSPFSLPLNRLLYPSSIGANGRLVHVVIAFEILMSGDALGFPGFPFCLSAKDEVSIASHGGKGHRRQSAATERLKAPNRSHLDESAPHFNAIAIGRNALTVSFIIRLGTPHRRWRIGQVVQKLLQLDARKTSVRRNLREDAVFLQSDDLAREPTWKGRAEFPYKSFRKIDGKAGKMSPWNINRNLIGSPMMHSKSDDGGVDDHLTWDRKHGLCVQLLRVPSQCPYYRESYSDEEPMLPASGTGELGITASCILTTLTHALASFFSTFLVLYPSAPTSGSVLPYGVVNFFGDKRSCLTSIKQRKTSSDCVVHFDDARARLSTIFLSTFLVIHLSAPIAANIGGSRLASSVMVEREYYQIAFGERYLLPFLFAIHVTSSVVALTLASNSFSPSGGPSTPKSHVRIRKLRSLLRISAYAALFFFVPTRAVIHRLLPTEVDAPACLRATSTQTHLSLSRSSLSCVPVRVAEVASIIYTWHIGYLRLATVEVFASPSGGNRTTVVAGATTLPVLESLLDLGAFMRTSFYVVVGLSAVPGHPDGLLGVSVMKSTSLGVRSPCEGVFVLAHRNINDIHAVADDACIQDLHGASKTHPPRHYDRLIYMSGLLVPSEAMPTGPLWCHLTMCKGSTS